MDNTLIGQYLNPKTKANYNIPLLKSYAGYPVVSAQELGLMDYFKNDGVNVGGMAWGGKTNPPGQGGGEAPSIVPNPYMFKNNAIGQNALVKLEASRHWMYENNYTPEFKITPEMQKWREEQFKDIGPAGEGYLKNDNLLKQTIISRIIGGDENVPLISNDVKKEAFAIRNKLEELDKKSKPTISDNVMSAIKLK